MLILADVGNVTEALNRLNKWIDNGGVLVRFAGPHLAGAEDNLVPVKLRRGGRILGGSLSWDKPQQLAGFSRDSPFNGMTVPTDITVTRQVLAEPDAQLTDRTWATLADGTPLVTAERRGKGLLVLFHVTAGLMVTVEVVTVVQSMASLKLMVYVLLGVTPVAPLVGTVVVTVGGVVSAPAETVMVIV